MLISQRMLIRNRARPGGVQEENIFSAFMLRSEGTHRMLISQRMLNRIQLTHANSDPDPHPTHANSDPDTATAGTQRTEPATHDKKVQVIS